MMSISSYKPMAIMHDTPYLQYKVMIIEYIVDAGTALGAGAAQPHPLSKLQLPGPSATATNQPKPKLLILIEHRDSHISLTKRSTTLRLTQRQWLLDSRPHCVP